MKALPFLLHPLLFPQMLAYPDRFKLLTISLFEGSSAKTKRHYRAKNISRNLCESWIFGVSLPTNTL
jgi:hypothetical protein